MEENFPPESIEGLEVSKVNIEVWRKIFHSTKHSDIRFQNLQNMILKNQSINCFLLESLHKGTKFTDPLELLELVKVSLKKCADSAMILGKLDQNLLTLRRDSITPELNIACKNLSFSEGEHPKLLFGDDLPRSIKQITETNKVGQFFSKKHFQSSPSGSNISLNPNTAGRNSGNKSILYGGRSQREKFKPNYQQSNRKNSHPYHYKNNRGYRH